MSNWDELIKLRQQIARMPQRVQVTIRSSNGGNGGTTTIAAYNKPPKKCSFMYADNHPCHRPYYAKGYCKQHYQTEPRDGGARFRKYGGPARDINDPDEPPISIPNFPDYSINPRGDVYNHKSGKWVDQTVDKLILVYDDRGEHSLDVAELLREVWGDWAVERYQNGGDE